MGVGVGAGVSVPAGVSVGVRMVVGVEVAGSSLGKAVRVPDRATMVACTLVPFGTGVAWAMAAEVNAESVVFGPAMDAVERMVERARPNGITSNIPSMFDKRPPLITKHNDPSDPMTRAKLANMTSGDLHHRDSVIHLIALSRSLQPVYRLSSFLSVNMPYQGCMLIISFV
jgi:hypothetical protein